MVLRRGVSYHAFMREGGFRNVGGLVQRLTSNIARGRGASIARLRVDWPAIVGDAIARSTEPEALIAGRSGKGATRLLRLRVAGTAALEVQHLSHQLVERVNAYFGHRQIDGIRLVQGVVSRRPQAPSRQPPPLAPETAARLARQVAKVQDPKLRAALERLGARVATGVKRRGVLLAVPCALIAPRAPRAQSEDAAKYLTVLPGDHVLGKPDAPNVIIDYFSLTCPHCANFNAAVLPTMKREWIDNGSTKLIMRHFPSDSIATHASLLAECRGPAKFYDSLDVLFRTQVDWLTAADPDAGLVKAIGRAGVKAEAAKACLGDDRLLNKIIADVQSGQALRVNATPSLFINDQFYGMPADGAAGITSILRQVGR